MPLFAVHAIDRPDTLQLRLDHYAAHRTFIEDQEAQGISVVMSGPLQSDDGQVMRGSLFILEAPSRAPIDAFVANDPFTLEGVWGEVRVSRFHARKSRAL
jgi:uncharacterized protein YciI